MGLLPKRINIKIPNVNKSGKCELALLIKFNPTQAGCVFKATLCRNCYFEPFGTPLLFLSATTDVM